jgi:hypothetical protein
MALAAGTILGSYEVAVQIGTGGMAVLLKNSMRGSTHQRIKLIRGGSAHSGTRKTTPRCASILLRIRNADCSRALAG